MHSGVPQSVAETLPFTSFCCDAVAQPAADSAPSSSSAVDTDDTHDATFTDDIIEAYAADMHCRHSSFRVFGGRKVALSCQSLLTLSGWYPLAGQ